MDASKHEFFSSNQVVKLSRFTLVNLNRNQVVSLNRIGVVNFTGFCNNAMQNPTTGIKTQQGIAEGINLAYVGKDENAILFTKGTNSEGSEMKIYDISGRLIETDKIERDHNTFIWNTSKYTEGVYVVNVTTNKNTQAVFKFIK